MAGITSRLETWLNARWYGPRLPGPLLRGAARCYGVLVERRRRSWAGRAWAAPVPVVVVGNISVGGTGKTPLTAWLARELVATGVQVGIVSRGYGRQRGDGPLEVTSATPVRQAGDEPLLLARETGCPVVVARDRPAACRHLLDTRAVDLILSDDGLQHYPLARQMEIVVLDAERGLGNGYILPAGPLREPPERLALADVVVWNGGVPAGERGLEMTLECREAVRLRDGYRVPLQQFAGQRVRAVAGIGHPERFFRQLSARGIEWDAIRPGDHGHLEPAMLGTGTEAVLMTDKDAVKLTDSEDPRLWRVPVRAHLPEGPSLLKQIQELVERPS